MKKNKIKKRTHNYEEFICKSCGKKFLRRKEKKKTKRTNSIIRKKGSVTCSKICSKKNIDNLRKESYKKKKDKKLRFLKELKVIK